MLEIAAAQLIPWLVVSINFIPDPGYILTHIYA